MRPEVIGLIGFGAFCLVIAWSYVYYVHMHFKDKHQSLFKGEDR